MNPRVQVKKLPRGPPLTHFPGRGRGKGEGGKGEGEGGRENGKREKMVPVLFKPVDLTSTCTLVLKQLDFLVSPLNTKVQRVFS